MASFYRDSSRNGWRVQVYVRGVRRKLWLGPVSKSAARSVAAHLDAINLARDTGTLTPEASRLWLASICDRIRNQLACWGLVDQLAARRDVPRQLGPYIQYLIDGRNDLSASALTRWKNVKLRLCAQLGAESALSAITVSDAARFARWARANIPSHSHSGKTISDARQFFKSAIADRLISDNPFSGIDSSQRHNRDREAYITRDDAHRIIAKADPHYAALIACARFGGLRVPSEALQLEWSHIDWDANRIAIMEKKTRARTIPLFPELLPHLLTLQEMAPDGAVYVFDRHRSTAARVYRATLQRLIARAGLKDWPKLWMNQRASCRTDLLAKFPTHVVNAWLGHSGKVGAAHYDRVTPDDYAAAVGSPVGSQCRVLPPPAALPKSKRAGKTRKPKQSTNS